MASEVVCGLVFRLLLPICLAVGECSVLMGVTKEDRRGPGRGLSNNEKESRAPGFGSESPLSSLSGRLLDNSAWISTVWNVKVLCSNLAI